MYINNLHYEKFADGTVECIEETLGYELPSGWTFTTIGMICSLQAGKFVSAADISPVCLDNMYPCYGGNGIRGYVEHYTLDGDYPIIGRQGALCGNVNMAHGKFYATEHAVVVTPMVDIDLNWLYYILVGLNLNQYAAGAAQPGLAVGNVLKVKLPLPPKNEQKRIAEAVDDALVYIEKLNEAKNDFSNIITLIKSNILDLAIRGKLVPQDPNDEPASLLLERIRTEKEELIKAGKIKRDKKESIIFKSEDNSYYRLTSDNKRNIIDIPFDIPDNWEWCNLSMIGSTNIGLTYKPADIVADGTMVLRSSNIINGKIDLSDLVRVNSTIRENQYIQENDILICARNGSKALVGKCAIFENVNEKASFGAFMAVYRSRFFRYVYYFLNSEFFRNTFSNDDSKQINQLTQDMIKNTAIPLPPFAEQKRIVEAIETAFAQLDEIANSIL